MPEELFDIVNENNQSLHIQKSRTMVHGSEPAWHRTTHIWIINDKKEMLCQQRSLTKDANPGKWQSFFGGHLKAGQTYEQNAVEELKEELGINANSRDLIPLYIRKSESAKHFAQVYVLRWDGSINDLHFDDDEVVKIMWFSQDELEKGIAGGQFCNAIDGRVIGYLSSDIG